MRVCPLRMMSVSYEEINADNEYDLSFVQCIAEHCAWFVDGDGCAIQALGEWVGIVFSGNEVLRVRTYPE